MPWIVGVDEAGYGPNLGPLAMAAVALWSPAPAGDCLWTLLHPLIGKVADRRTVRLVIDDSKAVHALSDGRTRLEHAAHLIAPWGTAVGDWLSAPLLLDPTPLREEHWFDPALPLPRHPNPNTLAFANLGVSGVRDGFARALLVPTASFNAIVTRSGSKGTVLGEGMARLVGSMLAELHDDREPVHFTLDRQGGRLRYLDYLQRACPDRWITILRETDAECLYRTADDNRPITWRFCPKADATSLTVAWASMTAKYLRELAMEQFNTFWCSRVEGLMPTAGYPKDANRFYACIEPHLSNEKLTRDSVWRCR